MDHRKEEATDEPFVELQAYWHRDLGLCLEELNLGFIHRGMTDPHGGPIVSGQSYNRETWWFRAAELILACNMLMESLDLDAVDVDHLFTEEFRQAFRGLEQALYPPHKPSDFDIPF